MKRWSLFGPRAVVSTTLMALSLPSPAAVGAAPPLEADALVTLSEQVEAPARSEGPLVELAVEEGQRVRLGETVARIDSRPSGMLADSARIELDKARHEAENDLPERLAEKKLALARQELGRVTDQVEQVGGVVSDSEVKRKQLAYDEAQLQLEHARRNRRAAALEVEAAAARLRQAELAVEQCRVPSILTGEVVQVLRRPGEWVRPGDSIVRLVRTDRLRVEAFLPLSAALQHKLAGAPAKVQVELGGESREFTGVVKYVHHDVSSHKDRVRVWAEVDNSHGLLRPGMKGRLTIETASPGSRGPSGTSLDAAPADPTP